MTFINGCVLVFSVVVVMCISFFILKVQSY